MAALVRCPGMTTERPNEDSELRVRELALRHGLPEDKVRALLDEHRDEGSLSEALRSLAHFLRAPS